MGNSSSSKNRRSSIRMPHEHYPAVFDVVKTIGLTFPGVEAATRYDGAPGLNLNGIFLAGLATHESAEPDTLVVRYPLENRDSLINDAPQTYYITDFYRRYPLVLVRLARISQPALAEMLTISWKVTAKKTDHKHHRQFTDDKFRLEVSGGNVVGERYSRDR
jgi:hypothetical protein